MIFFANPGKHLSCSRQMLVEGLMTEEKMIQSYRTTLSKTANYVVFNLLKPSKNRLVVNIAAPAPAVVLV